MPRAFPWISDERKRFTLGLILIALISAIPRLIFGTSQRIEYDGYWHVFIAQQDKWHNFWQDIRVNAHPPLFFLLLKFLIHFGRTTLIYRSISLVTGTISVYYVGSIARKITQSGPWAYTTALAYGLAMPAIIVSCEVRSYMLSSLFILISFSCLLDLTISSDPGRELRLRAGFVIAAILACLSHYYAFFYAGASCALLGAWFLVRKARGLRASWIAEISTILPLPIVIVILYKTHANLKAVIQPHLAPFYFDPSGTETISAFLIRNWKNLLNLFLPWQTSGDVAAIAIFLLAAISGIGLLLRLFSAREKSALQASWTILMTAGILGEIVVLAVDGKYPFGGDLRQQFVLFPFIVLFAAILASQLTTLIPEKGRLPAVSAVAIATVWISVVWYEQTPKWPEDVLADHMRAFDKLVPQPASVYLDQWNLITFFIYHHNWRWTSLGQQPVAGVDIYRITRGTRQMLVFRDMTEWNIRAENVDVYRKLSECLHATHVPEVSIFGNLQTPPSEPYSSFKVTGQHIARRAASDSICVQQLEMNTDAWYGTFRASGCTAPALAPPRATGAFDDTAEEIVYSGPWKHGPASAASGGTISISKVAGSTAHLEFEGTGITWMHGKGPDRGFASVRIDGIPRNDVDLYSPAAASQLTTTFDGLRPGDHTIDLMVAGRKDPNASGQYIDIDALIVK